MRRIREIKIQGHGTIQQDTDTGEVRLEDVLAIGNSYRQKEGKPPRTMEEFVAWIDGEDCQDAAHIWK